MRHLDEDLAALFVGLAFAEARLGVADQLARHDVDGDGDVEVVGAPALDQALVADGGGGEGPARAVEQGHNTLCAVEELAHDLDAEAVHEAVPHIGSQAVAEHGADLVLLVERAGGRVDEVAGRLADVDDGCGVGVADVGPEARGRELGADAA